MGGIGGRPFCPIIQVSYQLSKYRKNLFSRINLGARGNAVFAFNAGFVYNDGMQLDETPMATLTIRNVDAVLKERLRVRAAQHGHSMEAELREILKETLKEPERPPELNLYERIRARFAPLGGADDIELPPREPVPDPPRFD